MDGEREILLTIKGDGSHLTSELKKSAGATRQFSDELKSLDAEGRAAYTTLRALGETHASAMASVQGDATIKALGFGPSPVDNTQAEAMQAQTRAAAESQAALEQLAQAESNYGKSVQDAEAAAKRYAETLAGLDEKHRAIAEALQERGFSEQEAVDFSAQKQQAEHLDNLSKSYHEVAEGTDKAQRGSRAFAQTVSMVSPEAGEAARALHDMREAAEFLKNPEALATVGWAAALAGIMIAIKNITEELKKTNAEFAKFLQEQATLQGRTMQRETSVSEELAKQGKGSQAAFLAADKETKNLIEKGYKPDTAAQTAAALVDEQGNLSVDKDMEELLAAGSQAGFVRLGGDTPKERAKNLRAAIKAVNKNPGQFQQAAVSFKRPQQLLEQGAASGQNIAAMSQELQKELGMSAEDSAKAAEVIKEFSTGSKKPDRGFWDPIEGGVIETLGNAAGHKFEAQDREERFALAERTRTKLGNAPDQWAERGEQAPRTPTVTPQPSPGGTTINNHYHGPSYHGPSKPRTTRRLAGAGRSRQ